MWLDIKNCIRTTAVNCLGVKARNMRTLWFNDTCKAPIEMKRIARQKWLANKNNKSAELDYKEKSREATKIIRKEKRTT